jgi:hypothetical protein
MSMDVPMSGRVPGIVGEVGNARQFPDRNLRQQKKKSPPSGHSEEPETLDPSELAADSDEGDAGDDDGLVLADSAEIDGDAGDDDGGDTGDPSPASDDVSTLADSIEIEASDDDDTSDLSPASANGLTLTDVKAVYDSN